MLWNNLGAGLVVITVSAFNIPKPPQNYALVVQGRFTGQLNSTFNPAYTSALPTTSCTLPVARITSSPPILTNNLNPTWAFRTASDPAPNGFQCKLSGAGGSVTATARTGTAIPLHDWATCVSPVTSTFVSTAGSADGAYLFQVRARGEMVHLVQQITYTVYS